MLGIVKARSPKRRWPFGTSRVWNEIEPWAWLRHITPWWLLYWLFGRYHICWSGMAMWKLGYDWSWSLNKGCFHPFDYCGWYDHTATAEERTEGLRIAGELPVLVKFPAEAWGG